jgi:hypothetical protein
MGKRHNPGKKKAVEMRERVYGKGWQRQTVSRYNRSGLAGA